MPDTLAGLLIFAALAMPGLVYTARRRLYSSGPTPSAFIELATIVTISLVALGAALIVLLVADSFFPEATPDLDALAREPRAELAESFRRWLAWCAGLLGLATLGAWGAARRKYPDDEGAVVKSKSLWQLAFRDWDESAGSGYVYLRIRLKGGLQAVEGFLREYDARFDATEDRDLLLSAPISIVEPDGTRRELEADYLWMAARAADWVSISHGRPHPSESGGNGGTVDTDGS